MIGQRDPLTALAPMRAVVHGVKELRTRRGWTAERLGEEMAKLGFRWDRYTVGNLERGRRRSLTVEELLGLAYVLDVAPVHLLVPVDETRPYAVAPEATASANAVREWIRGSAPLPGRDPRLYFSEVPLHEFERLDRGEKA
jgi:transcriptional regulator with XRE-family HTH domain